MAPQTKNRPATQGDSQGTALALYSFMLPNVHASLVVKYRYTEEFNIQVIWMRYSSITARVLGFLPEYV